MTKNNSRSLDLFLRGRKGLSILKSVESGSFPSLIGQVFVDTESNVAIEYSDQIFALAEKLKLNARRYEKTFTVESDIALAAGWQYLLKIKNLMVIHDSLLPRYRGFNPLVSMLLNEEPEIGATLIWANAKPDVGPIIKSESCKIYYPIKFADALEKISEIYENLALFIFSKLVRGEKFESIPQNEENASYSLWRDELDYQIDWSCSADQIQKFIFSVGTPYLGASSLLQGRKVRILDCAVIPDRKIENRQIGKVFSLDDGQPVVVCGKGLLLVTDLIEDAAKLPLLPMSSLKVRFGSHSL